MARWTRGPSSKRAVKELAARGTLPVVKRGERGALAFADGEFVEVPARPATVVDAVGAGGQLQRGPARRPPARPATEPEHVGRRDLRHPFHPRRRGTAAQPTWEEATS
ncbi:hypothetical protein GCM10020220_050960 [Nonomuraea rubra]|uniref:PfkB family carbohydrate kinase n=1 Tax=Nonomuraea rubra TaxID=46180 RepID=UPI00337E2F8B